MSKEKKKMELNVKVTIELGASTMTMLSKLFAGLASAQSSTTSNDVKPIEVEKPQATPKANPVPAPVPVANTPKAVEVETTQYTTATAVKARVSEVSAIVGKDPIREIIKTQFGVSKVAELPKEKWTDFIMAINALIPLPGDTD